MTDATRRGFVAGLLALAGCAGGQSGDRTPSGTTDTTDASSAATTEPTDATTTTENCHYEAKEVEHTGVLEVANETDGEVSFDVTVRDAAGDAVFAHPVGADAGERNVVFRTSDGGEYTVGYEPEAGYGVTEWSVPDSGSARYLTLVVSETDGGQTTVDARAHTADPPATRVCE